MKPRPKQSIRRKMGDWVWLTQHAGFSGASHTLRAEIVQEAEDGWDVCMLGCGDPNCVEWPTLWTEPDPEYNGERHMLCHVSECQMYTWPAPPHRRIWRWRQIQRPGWYGSTRRPGDSPKAIARKRRKNDALMAAKSGAR